jgi:hypothetical protein
LKPFELSQLCARSLPKLSSKGNKLDLSLGLPPELPLELSLERPQAHTSEGFKHVLNIKNLYIEKKKKN